MANQIMKMADWLDMARDFPTHAEAEQYRQRNGIQIEGEKSVNYSDYGELPPLSQASSLAATQQVAEPEEAVSTMDEEEETGAEDAMGGLDLANLDFSKMRGDPAIFQQILQASIAANKRAEQSAKKLYEEGRKRIMEKYAGPSQSERLFALSRAMLSPTDFPGFKGFLGNVTGALSENAKAQRMAEQAREEQLFNLQQQYQQEAATRAAALPKTAADLALRYLTATKSATGSAYDTQRGIFVNRNNPRPTENTYTIPGTKRTLVQWQDGYWREELPGGTYRVFERAGNAFKEVEGNPNG